MGEISKYFEYIENRNIVYQNLWDVVIEVFGVNSIKCLERKGFD